MFPGALPGLEPIRATYTSPLENEEPIFKGVLKGDETLQRIVFGEGNMHQSFVYFVMKDATVKKIRKIVVNTRETEAAFDGAGNEITIYNALKKKEGWKKYILPFEGSVRGPKTVVLDFDYIPGMDMVEYVNQIKPSRAKLKELFEQAKAALKFCHSHNVLHGDIKPDNFYVSADGEHCYIFDFGNGYTEDDIDEELLTQEEADMHRMIERVLAYATGGGRRRQTRRGGRRHRKLARGTKKGRR
jgi:serine/threonine protein kinase